jgi:hypothetical protein
MIFAAVHESGWAHRDASLRRTDWVAIGGIADMPGASRTSGCDATDPTETLAAKFAVMHNAAQTHYDVLC